MMRIRMTAAMFICLSFDVPYISCVGLRLPVTVCLGVFTTQRNTYAW